MLFFGTLPLLAPALILPEQCKLPALEVEIPTPEFKP
jgi:hypothetical protein